MHLRTRVLVYLQVAFQASLIANGLDNVPFKPRDYVKSAATCTVPGLDKDAVEIELQYVDVNPTASSTLMMVHGWPGLWSAWSNQIQEFQNDYHLIVPDLRGFGSSTHPGDMQGTMGDLVGDLVCVMKHAKVQSAICIGHDWGSQICFEAARMRPDRFTAISTTLPYIPSSGPFVTPESLVSVFPRLNYLVFFDKQTSKAVAELNEDLRRTIRASLRTVDSRPPPEFLTSRDTFLGGWNGVAEIPPVPFFSSDEEDYFVEQYAIQGFGNNLQFYIHTNRYKSWVFGHHQGNHTISQPALVILPLNDTVADWIRVSAMLKSADYLPHLSIKTLEASHWPQLERPKEFNTFLREWLRNLPASVPPASQYLPDGMEITETRHRDEL